MLASILVWFAASFGFTDGSFGLVDELSGSILYSIGNSFAWIFTPLGFGEWKPAIATILGLAAKEEVVGVFGVLTSIGNADIAYELADSMNTSALSPIAALFSGPLASYSFLIFNLLCAPCFAAMNTIRQEMNNWKWTSFAIGYQCAFAYVISMIIYQLGMLFSGNGFTLWTAISLMFLAGILYMLFRPAPKYNLGKKVQAGIPAVVSGKR